ncbi:MAG: PEGA domain-containing protein [Vicinamibacterales bacterium]
MAIAVAKDQTSLADGRLPLSDPLLLFACEDPTAVVKTGEVTSRISAPACPRLVSPSVERARRQAPNGRWIAGTTMLVVGLLIGYAAGIATTTGKPEPQNASGNSYAADHADSASRPVAIQATADQSYAGPSAEAVNDERQVGEPNSRTSPPQSSRRPLSPSVGTEPATALGVLHVESRPTGAQVHLNDRLVATTPFRLYRVPSGSHTVRMELEGYKPLSTSVDVAGGSLVRVAGSLEIDLDWSSQ